MTNRDRVKLLFGPYRSPPLNRGDRATCLYRDALVIVTSWTDAPIPWPRCRALDSPGGGSGLLVDEELARAVRNESAAAVMHWWGAGQRAVWAWRKALGVGRVDSQGSRRLIQAAAEQGAEAIRAREWTEKERQQRRRVNAEKGLARNLVTGYHGPLWAPADIALLGAVLDDDVTRRTGRTLEAVRQKREEMGIPNLAGNRWSAEAIALLGTMPDREVARRLCRSLQSVTQKRIKLRIANPSTRALWGLGRVVPFDGEESVSPGGRRRDRTTCRSRDDSVDPRTDATVAWPSRRGC